MLAHKVPFDADQEELAFKAKEILTGNAVLLGPKTSLGGFSIGPGFVYLWALFSLFLKGNPIAGAYLSVFLGVLLTLGVYLILRQIFSERIALAISFVMALSINFVSWDQIPWAPSLFYLSELITLYGVYISKNKKYGLPLVALGLGIGFQSHFAVFLLLLPIIVYLLVYRPIVSKKNIVFSSITLAVSVLPVVIFDLFHGFINLQRLLSIFSLGREGFAPAKFKILTTLISNSTNVFWPHFSAPLAYLIFSAVILFSLWGIYKNKTYRQLLILSNLFLFIPFFIFLFYKSNFTEYYLMTAVIPFLFILGYAFWAIKKWFVILVVLGIFSFLNIRSFAEFVRPINLWAKEQVVREIINRGGKNGYGVSLGVSPGNGFGFSYLFDYYHARPDIPPLKGQQKIFTIIVPPGYEGIRPIIQVDGVGLRWEEE